MAKKNGVTQPAMGGNKRREGTLPSGAKYTVNRSESGAVTSHAVKKDGATRKDVTKFKAPGAHRAMTVRKSGVTPGGRSYDSTKMSVGGKTESVTQVGSNKKSVNAPGSQVFTKLKTPTGSTKRKIAQRTGTAKVVPKGPTKGKL